MKIVFIGAVKFSEKVLSYLVQLNADVVGVCTLENSKFNSDHCDLTDLSMSNMIKVKYTKNINSEENIEWIKSLDPDIIFCLSLIHI